MVKLGQRLHTLRLQRKLTLEQVAAEIRIKSSFLAAIERSEYNKLPSPAYAQGFVRNYASYLGLSRGEITALFKREFDEKRAYKVLPDSMLKTKEFPLQRMHIQQSLVFFVIIFILVVGYLFIQYRAAFLPPSLEITAPKTDSTTSQEITVTGKTDSNATVTINDQQVAPSSDGTFSKQITLFPGSTTISIKATNRFGKVSTIQRNIVVH
jgi:cytoskeletal protein RodZ